MQSGRITNERCGRVSFPTVHHVYRMRSQRDRDVARVTFLPNSWDFARCSPALPFTCGIFFPSVCTNKCVYKHEPKFHSSKRTCVCVWLRKSCTNIQTLPFFPWVGLINLLFLRWTLTLMSDCKITFEKVWYANNNDYYQWSRKFEF